MNIFKIDPVHSHIGFKIRHMMLAKVHGRFEKYEATLQMSNSYFEDAKLNFTAQTASINTHNADRDRHLRSEDFFHADIHRKILFVSTAIRPIQKHRYKIEGLLTMNGLKNPVVLETVYHQIQDKNNRPKIVLQMVGKIDRLDWNMKWNRPLESGGILVSKEVKLQIDCEFFLAQ